VPVELATLLDSYSFPGNVRELEAMVFDAVALSEGRTLSLRSLKQAIFRSDDAPRGVCDDADPGLERVRLPTLREAESDLISRARSAAPMATRALPRVCSACRDRLWRAMPTERCG
jgi:DNA-binding NtrC family response regulator